MSVNKIDGISYSATHNNYNKQMYFNMQRLVPR